jgi:CheY-like chemotaxis protein
MSQRLFVALHFLYPIGNHCGHKPFHIESGFLTVGGGGSVSGSKSREVLIVEDEWLVRMEIADAFLDLGFTVIESASAEHGIEALHDNPGVTLLVTDIRLAGPRDGWDLAIEARAARPGIAVVYLSANPPASDKMVEGSVFIDKPALMEKVTGTALELLCPE